MAVVLYAEKTAQVQCMRRVAGPESAKWWRMACRRTLEMVALCCLYVEQKLRRGLQTARVCQKVVPVQCVFHVACNSLYCNGRTVL